MISRHASDEEKAKQDPAYHLRTTNLETRETLAELYKEYKGDELLASTMKEPEAKKTDKLNAVRINHYAALCWTNDAASTVITWLKGVSLISSLRFKFFIYLLL